MIFTAVKNYDFGCAENDDALRAIMSGFAAFYSKLSAVFMG